jgi:spermidine synthase
MSADLPETSPEMRPAAPVSPIAAWRGLALLYGAGAMMAQVLILRELLVLAQGHELRLALGLWAWLVWTGLGSLLGGWRGGRVATLEMLGGLLALLGVLLPLTLLAIRAAPAWGLIPWGASLPVGRAFVLFLALLAPFGLASGYFFPCACRVLAALDSEAAVGRTYYLETLGAAAGVVILQVMLLGRYASLALSLGLGLLLAGGTWAMALPQTRPRRAALFGLTALLVAALWLAPALERLSRGWQWPGRTVLAAVDSPYALLAVSREAEQFSFLANNQWQFTYPDPQTAEHQVQVALLEHPRPEAVLLLGGGLAGLGPEIFKTRSVQRLDYVELDPQLAALERQWLPPAAGAVFRDPRLQVHYADARRYVETAAEPYDVIIMALPEPRSAQLNRFYTREFFQAAARRLRPPGVFSLSLGGSETGFNPLRAAYLAMIHRTLQQAFPEVLALPGARVRFLASVTPGSLTGDAEALVQRLKERHLPLTYVREYYLLDDLSPARQAYLAQMLSAPPPEVNLDLAPGVYFYDLALSGLQEGLGLNDLLRVCRSAPPWTVFAGLALALLAAFCLGRRRPGAACLVQVMVMGLGVMALEVALLALYQIALGSLYHHLGLLIAACMAGLAAGGVLGTRLARRARPAFWVGLGQMALAGVNLSLLGFLHLGRPAAGGLGEWLAHLPYLLGLGFSGLAGGAVFALAAAWWSQTRAAPGAVGGALYAVDLLGATVGALGVSLLALPVWGFQFTLLLLAALHAGASLLPYRRPARCGC